MNSGNLLDPTQPPPDYSLEGIIKGALYAVNLIFSSDSPDNLIRYVVACVLVLNNFSFKVHEAFSNQSLRLLEVKRIVQEWGGHLELHPNIAGIVAAKEENNSGYADDSLQKEVTSIPTPESNNPIPMSSNRSLTSL